MASRATAHAGDPLEPDPAEFARWLRLGLGRAILYLQTHDPTPFRRLIREAVFHNLQYESMEPTRGRYVLDLIALSGEADALRQAVLMALDAMPAEELDPPSDCSDARQLSGVAALLAKEGDAEARHILYEAAGRKPTAYRVVEALVEFSPIEGLLFVADALGRRRLDGEDVDQACVTTFHHAADSTDDATAQAALIHAASDNPRVAAFMRAVHCLQDERNEWAKSRRSPRGLDYDEIAGWMQECRCDSRIGPYPWKVWGRHASEGDLLRAAQRFLDLPDDDPVLLHHVHLFHDRAFPLALDRLVALARRGRQDQAWSLDDATLDDRVARAAHAALANVRHPTVRTLAFELLATSRWTSNAIDILVGNYEEGDSATVKAVFLAETDPHERHGMTLTLLRLDEETRPPSIEEALLVAYEHGPCAFCRESIIRDLIEIDALPSWIRDECRFDANPAIRALVGTSAATTTASDALAP